MFRSAVLSSVALAAPVACTTTTSTDTSSRPAATQSTVDQFVADARQIAGEDLSFLMPICNPQPAVRAAPSAAMDESLARAQRTPLSAVSQWSIVRCVCSTLVLALNAHVFK